MSQRGVSVLPRLSTGNVVLHFASLVPLALRTTRRLTAPLLLPRFLLVLALELLHDLHARQPRA